MNIVYLHGLDSKLSAEKKAILERYGEVNTPDLNYYTNPDAIATILQMLADVQIDVVIGSSMGGFAAYHVSNALKKPGLMFNPALVERSVTQNVPDIDSFNPLKQIVLGQMDEVVSPIDTLSFLTKDFNPVTDVHIHLVPALGHNIPVDFFKEEVDSFFRKL
ncbi:alpha/beta hydrolase [Salinimicrobium sp. CDJ15-81-2]|nr:alpha/beta hydrolase [Salinimicrobium nanhaiense]